MTKILEASKVAIANFISYLIVGIVIFFFCKLIMFLISKQTGNVISKENKKEIPSREKITSMTVLRSICRYIVCILGIFLFLTYMGFNSSVENVLVTAGVGGLIISLGAQSFVKDLISGFFIIFERQYSVGDFVEINGLSGKVTAVSVRATYLDRRGQKIIIPNGQVETVINYNNLYNEFRFSIPTAYEQNTKKIINVIQDVLDYYYINNKEIFVEKPEVLGIENFNSSSVDILVHGKCKTLMNYQAEREIKLLIKETFDKKKIEIPYQKINLKK